MLEKIIKIVAFTRWLVVALILAIVFWEPILIITTHLPLLVQKSKSITVAGMSMKIKNQMSLKPTARFNESINGLTPEALIELSSLKDYDKPHKSTMDIGSYLDWGQQLEERGLIRMLDDEIIDSVSNMHKGYAYTPTEMGIKSGKIMRDLISTFIKQLTTSKDSSSKDSVKLGK